MFLDVINPVAALEDPLPVVEALAPFAVAGHVKDFELESIQTEGGYHRRGFSVLYRYPGRGVGEPAGDLVGARGRAPGTRAAAGRRGARQPRRRAATRSSGCAASFEHLRGLVPAPAGA